MDDKLMLILLQIFRLDRRQTLTCSYLWWIFLFLFPRSKFPSLEILLMSQVSCTGTTQVPKTLWRHEGLNDSNGGLGDGGRCCVPTTNLTLNPPISTYRTPESLQLPWEPEKTLYCWAVGSSFSSLLSQVQICVLRLICRTASIGLFCRLIYF